MTLRDQSDFRTGDEIREKQGGMTKLVLAVKPGESIEALSSGGRRTKIAWAQLRRYEVIHRSRRFRTL